MAYAKDKYGKIISLLKFKNIASIALRYIQDSSVGDTLTLTVNRLTLKDPCIDAKYDG